jgi:hypothetical protein
MIRNRDLTIVAIGIFLALQVSFATYGVRLVRGIASVTHAELSLVGGAGH